MSAVFNHRDWLVWEQNCSPMLLTLTFNPAMRDLKDYLGTAWPPTIVVYEKNQGIWLNRWKDLKDFGQKMIDFLMCPSYRVSFLTAYDRAEEKLLSRAKEIQFSIDLSKLNKSELNELFKELSDLYYNWYKLGWFCEPLEFQAQDIISDYLDELMVDGKLEEDVGDVKQYIYTSDEDLFSIEILRDLHECAKSLEKVLRSQTIRDQVISCKKDEDFPLKAAETILEWIKSKENSQNREVAKRLKNHSQRYYWKQNNYFSTRFLTELDILKELFSVENFDIDNPQKYYEVQLRKFEESKKANLLKRNARMKQFDAYHRNILVLANLIGGALKDKRKRTIMISNSVFDRIFEEVARRTGYEIEDIRLLIPQELQYFLESPEDYKERFPERRKKFIVYQGDFNIVDEAIDIPKTVAEDPLKLQYKEIEMHDPFIAEGSDAEKYLNQLNAKLYFMKTAEEVRMDRITGVVAYMDPDNMIITGKVRIIRNPKTESLKEGEILVAPSTTPDYLDAIHRSKAIITDWGGQTSHAAIASRELKKPCIIGTNYGSQILKNGDSVRIDFEEAMIQILEGGGT